MQLLINGYCATKCPHRGFLQSADVVCSKQNSVFYVINYVVNGV